MRAVAVVLAVAALLVAALWLRGPDGAPGTAAAPEPPLDLPKEGARIALLQRHDAEVPGSAGRFRVHVGDLTRGQVEFSMSRADGTPVLAPRSVRERDALEFPVGDRRYRVTVVELKNKLVGNDTIVLDFSEGMSERDRIEALLGAIETSGLVFLRNGSEHDGAAAAKHLRRKLDAAGDRVRTAEEFIEAIATKSSTSGEPYRVRLADGSRMDLAAWLRGRLGD